MWEFYGNGEYYCDRVELEKRESEVVGFGERCWREVGETMHLEVHEGKTTINLNRETCDKMRIRKLLGKRNVRKERLCPGYWETRF